MAGKAATAGRIRRPRRGLAALRGIQGFRRAVQVTVLGFIGWLVAGRLVAGASGESGTSLSPEALCPFGGRRTRPW